MNNCFSKKLNEEFAFLDENGMHEVTEFCMTEPSLGFAPKCREINSWVYIFCHFARIGIEECNRNYSMGNYELLLNNLMGIFFSIPPKYRNKVYSQVNKELAKEGLAFTLSRAIRRMQY